MRHWLYASLIVLLILGTCGVPFQVSCIAGIVLGGVSAFSWMLAHTNLPPL